MKVISDNSSGLLFKNKRDRKIVTVDPKVIYAVPHTTVTHSAIGCVSRG